MSCAHQICPESSASIAVRPWKPVANTLSPAVCTAESMSTGRSSSVRPCGDARAVSQTVSPECSDTAITLPLSKPLIATSLAMIGVAVPRKLKRGTCCSTDQSSLPVCASRQWSLPSTDRITTSSSLIAGADSNSEFKRTRHTSRPVAPSIATTAPLLLPTTTSPAPALGPADNGIFRFLTQTRRPVSSAVASTSPLCEAANTTPLSTAGPNPKRSTNCFLPPPTPSPHSFLTGSVAGNLTSTAGGSTSLSLLQPAAISSAARPMGSNKRIRVWPYSVCLRNWLSPREPARPPSLES